MIRLPAALGLLIDLRLIAFLAAAFWLYLPEPQVDLLGAIMKYGTYAMSLALLLIPGTKGPDRYGERAIRRERRKATALTE